MLAAQSSQAGVVAYRSSSRLEMTSTDMVSKSIKRIRKKVRFIRIGSLGRKK